MALLHNTEIQSIVNSKIHGKIARVGGRMNQLLEYKNCRVTDINIVDGGYGMVRNKFSMQNLKSFYKAKRRQLRQEIWWMMYGEREMRDRKTIILDMHFAMLNRSLATKFDCSISSNVIEHSPNPIWFLLNFHYITSENGYQYHAIPNYRYTFDQYRKPTKLQHLIDDFEQMLWFDDTTHNQDYVMSAVEKHGHQKPFHEKYPVSYPFIHFHVFDEYNTAELMRFMFSDVTVDVIKSEKFNDNIVIFRNKLNDDFVNKYAVHIEKFTEFVSKKASSAQYSKI